MKLMTVMIAALFLFSTSWAQGQHTQSGRTESMQTASNFTKVAPALEKYARGPLAELWKRPGLTPRDRSLVTIAALIARNQTVEMPYYFDLALNNGVKASELSEVITHLAFYSGWSNAASAVAIAKDVFERRGIGPDQLPPASPELLPLNEDAEADRAARVEQDFGKVAAGVVQYTTDLLFRDLWLRPALTPRDRSLVTVSALIASGQVAQITYHLNRAMDNGLTKSQKCPTSSSSSGPVSQNNRKPVSPTKSPKTSWTFSITEKSLSRSGLKKSTQGIGQSKFTNPISRTSGTSSTKNLDTKCEWQQYQNF